MRVISVCSFGHTGCPNATTCTLILRGGSDQFLEETERSLHDAIMIVRRTIRNDSVIAGKFLFVVSEFLQVLYLLTSKAFVLYFNQTILSNTDWSLKVLDSLLEQYSQKR